MTQVIEILSWACVLGGIFFCFIGAVGMLRFPDFFARVHAAGVTDTLGSILIFVGLMLQTGVELNLGRLAFIAFLLTATSPVAGHAVARSAYEHGVDARIDGEDITDD